MPPIRTWSRTSTSISEGGRARPDRLGEQLHRVAVAGRYLAARPRAARPGRSGRRRGRGRGRRAAPRGWPAPARARARPAPPAASIEPRTWVVDHLVGGEEAVLLALEVLVEGAAGDLRRLGDLADRGRVVAVLGDRLDDAVEQPLALVLGDEGARQAVAPRRQAVLARGELLGCSRRVSHGRGRGRGRSRSSSAAGPARPLPRPARAAPATARRARRRSPAPSESRELAGDARPAPPRSGRAARGPPFCASTKQSRARAGSASIAASSAARPAAPARARTARPGPPRAARALPTARSKAATKHSSLLREVLVEGDRGDPGLLDDRFDRRRRRSPSRRSAARSRRGSARAASPQRRPGGRRSSRVLGRLSRKSLREVLHGSRIALSKKISYPEKKE